MERIKRFFKSDFFKTLVTYVGIILIVVIIRIFVIDPIRVDGSSMVK